MRILDIVSSGIIHTFGVYIPLHVNLCVEMNEREVEQRVLLIVTKFFSTQSFVNK